MVLFSLHNRYKRCANEVRCCNIAMYALRLEKNMCVFAQKAFIFALFTQE